MSRPVPIARVLVVSGIASREGRAALRRHPAGFALGAAALTWIMSAVALTIAQLSE